MEDRRGGGGGGGGGLRIQPRDMTVGRREDGGGKRARLGVCLDIKTTLFSLFLVPSWHHSQPHRNAASALTSLIDYLLHFAEDDSDNGYQQQTNHSLSTNLNATQDYCRQSKHFWLIFLN
ncbi:hypothetical protein ABVT39_016485 [Epinephelus coioides]